MAVQCQVRTSDSSDMSRLRGDIIQIKQVPCVWGNEENLPLYLIIEISDTNINDSEIQQWKKRHVEEHPGSPQSKKKRSNYGFNLDSLSQNYEETRPHLIISYQEAQNNVLNRPFK